MKKITIVLMTICCMLIGVFSPTVTAFAAGNNTVIVFEGAKQEQNKVTIDVNVRENSGVYSMLLTLDYDTSALTLSGLTYGDALSSLDPLSSGDYSVTPYKISYMGKENSNDVSIGKMMTLTFTVNENTADGEYFITFVYTKNRDVTYLSDGEIATKNLVISGAKITLKNSGVEDVITEDKEQEGEKESSGGSTAWTAFGCGATLEGAVGYGASLFAMLVLLLKRFT